METILIITYDMIPGAASWGGCQRMYFLAEQLLEKNYKVIVYSVDKGRNQYYGNEIHFINQQIKMRNEWIASFISSKLIDSNNQGKKGKSKLINRVLASVRRTIKSNRFLLEFLSCIDNYFYNEPTYMAGVVSLRWIKENTDIILQTIRTNSIKNIIISVPAFHMMAIGGKIKKAYGNAVNIIYDYRDPWNLWKQQSKYCLRKEQRYLRAADIVVCTNENLKDAFIHKFHIPAERISVVANGFSNKSWNRVKYQKRHNENIFCISYVGSIEIIYSGIRNIECLLEAYRQFVKKHNDILLRFVGVNDLSLDNVTKLRKEFKEKIEFVKNVSTIESLNYMLDSDALLLLHTINDDSSQYIVSGKMYDYIRAGKRILSIGADDGIHKRMIEMNGLGYAVNNDKEEILTGLEHLYDSWKNSETILDKIDVDMYSREYQNCKYMQLFR